MATTSPKAVREWCRITCANYSNVEIKNMSTSFRDGLAFCAIIHRHRPDLIDFSSLSKDNVYLNNKLAFEIAERKLGIPAFLDPKDMVTTRVPDCLSVITYLCQYYYYFNRKSSAGLASSKSSHVTFFNNFTKNKTPGGLKALKSSTDLRTRRKDRLSNTRPQAVCNLCSKPVHLIQRHLTDGEVYHRSCFRCKVCHSTLLPGSYTKGSDDRSLICSHHITDSNGTRVDLNQQTRSAENRPKCEFQASYFSLGGLAITSVPHYSKTTESQDRLVCKTPEIREGRERQEISVELKNRENRTVGLKCTVNKPVRPLRPPPPPPPSVEDGKGSGKASPILTESRTQQEATKTQEPSELYSSCVPVTEGNSRPVPAPRRMLESSVVPVPAPRTKTAQPMNTLEGNSPNSSHITSPTRYGPKVHTNHPWISIVHPGPWTQLPPIPSPLLIPRYKFISGRRRPSRTTRSTPDDDDDDVRASRERAGDTSQLGLSDLDETGATGGVGAASDEAQSPVLPRSLSVPAITSAPSESSILHPDLTETNESDQVMSCGSKPACKENPFDRKPAMTKSKTFQAIPATRAPAPGHGFPLVKRKVQTDQNVSTEDLQVEMSELDKHLEALEQRGIELEGNLRDCKNDEEEEQMLMEWFSLIHEKNVLVRRDTELVHLRKQQELEERQAEVEYELRCLLNKPEGDWSRKERGREQKLMKELVAVIEQRNQIISTLDQDRQRESEEDKVSEAMMKDKEFQKEGLKELKKSKGKFNPTKMFKMLNQ
ncbi:MICAL-like protein 1 isoform X1 [Sebastes fasciatus]|uniref:MICAL-like protein 1 isoform X1 n=1 Tax=Sebastes fasciatus TaxID=394691 RepID=UPI003D9DB39E